MNRRYRSACQSGLQLASAMLVLYVVQIARLMAGDVTAETNPAKVITADEIRAHVAYLADPARLGRKGAGRIEARDYIVARFEEWHLKPLFGEKWLQTLPSQVSGEGPPEGENVGAFVRGTDPELRDEWIIINAHYDHLGVRGGQVYPGADDNASGVAMLLEVARRVAAHPLKRSVAFVAFDCEESLLWGSRWFVAHSPIPLERIHLCLTADMIGRSLGGLGLPTVFVMGAEHSHVLREALQSVSVPNGLDVAQLGADMVGTRSDYGPFRDAEIPFLFFSTGEHPDYHTPGDTIAKVNFPNAARVSTLIDRLVVSLGNRADSLTWEPPHYQKLAEAQAVSRITSQLLEADAAGRIDLSGTQSFLVSQVRNKTDYMVKVNRVSDEERKWVARMAQAQLWEVETQRYRVLTDVRLKFYEALAAQRRRRLASEFHSVAEKGVEVAKLRRKALEGSVPEILQSEIQLSEVDLIQRRSDIAYRAAWKEMASVAGLPHLQMQPLLGELRVDAPDRDWEMTYAQLRASSPAIQAAQARAGRAAAMLERQEVQPIPNLLASMAAGVDNGANSGMLNVQVGIPLPIFNKNSGNISAAYSEYCRASQEVQRLELKLRQDLAAAAGEYDSAIITCQQYENRILPRALQTLELSEQAYEAGEFDFLRVLVARRTYYETNLEYNTALLNLARAYWRIEGILLEGGLGQTPDTTLGDGLRGQSLSGE